MKLVAEIMYVVEAEREEFLKGALHPDEETKKVLWLCGVRRQQYFALNDLIFMTFEYEGDHFQEDMSKMAAYLDSKGHLVQKRRKDVPLEERATTNWWAPVKKLGALLEMEPALVSAEDKSQENYMAMLDGCMGMMDAGNDISFDEEEWLEDVHIWKTES